MTDPRVPVDAITRATNGVQRNARQIASGLAGVSTIALLAAAAALPFVADPGAALAGLGSNALAGWLATWAAQRSAAGEVFDEDATFADLARAMDRLDVVRDVDVAADVQRLIAQTDATAVVLAESHTEQQRWFRMLAEDIQRARVDDDRLHAATYAALEQRHAELAVLLEEIKARPATQVTGRVNVGTQTGGKTVGVNIEAIKGPVHIDNATILPPPPLDLAAAHALLATLPTAPPPPAPTALPAGSCVRFTPNAVFVGRDAALCAVAQALAGGTAVITAGIGGVGKTQLAIEAAHRYGQYFAGGVFWLSFANDDQIAAQIVACGGPGGMGLVRDGDGLTFADQVERVLGAWRDSLPRLLIFDNCEDEAVLRTWQQQIAGGGCRVLVTSRRPQWSADLRLALVPVETLDRSAGVDLLRKLCVVLDATLADQIAAELGDLPLALHLAGNFLARYHRTVPPAHYLTALRSPTLLDHPSLTGRGTAALPTDRDPHVGRAFALSLDRLNADDPTDAQARALLARSALLAPGEPFPRDLLVATAPGDDGLLTDDAIARLVDLGLIEVNGEALRLHRLIAAYTAGAVVDEGAMDAVENAIIATLDVADSKDHAAAVAPIRMHLLCAVERVATRTDVRAGSLLHDLALALSMQGHVQAARPLYERALTIHEATLGPEHPSTAAVLHNFAQLLLHQGYAQAARPLYERALTIHEATLGPEHPKTATTLNDLGAVSLTLEEYESAYHFFQRALAIRETTLGAGHPDVAQSLNNLGWWHHDVQHDYEAAHAYFVRALAILEAALDPQHPDVANSIHNIAGIRHAQGDYAGALPLYARALTIKEKALGSLHHDIASTVHNLAMLYVQQGAFDAALLLFDRACMIREIALGPQHCDTVTSQQLRDTTRMITTLLANARAAVDRAISDDEVDCADLRTQLVQTIAKIDAQTSDDSPRRLVVQRLYDLIAELDAALPAPVRIIAERAAQAMADLDATIAQALADPTTDRTNLLASLDERAAYFADGEAEGSPWRAVAAHCRTLAAQVAVASAGDV